MDVPDWQKTKTFKRISLLKSENVSSFTYTHAIQEKVNIECEEIILHSWTTTVLDPLISNKRREKWKEKEGYEKIEKP